MHVVNPVCCASRASFLSGQYSHNNGVWDNKWGPRPGGFNVGEPFFPERLGATPAIMRGQGDAEEVA